MWMDHDEFMPFGEEGMGSEFGGLSNVSAVLQTKKVKAGFETFQYDTLLKHFR